MAHITDSPPRAPPIQYAAPLGTRWAKEKAAAGGTAAFDLPSDPRTIGPWILGECVGKGASGRVKIAKHRRTGQLAAVKILPIAPLVNSRSSLATQQAKSEKQRLGIDREITMMKLMNHPNIMRIYDVFEGEKELFLVLEYIQGGELFDFLVNRGRLPPNEALEYFKQIIYGLNYAHTFSIIHRDLKPENILIASLKPPVIKIADWGMAAFAPPTLQLETSCGSPHYASPEIVNGEKYQGNATDIWSCGVILFALLTGRLPFDDKNVRNLLAKVKTGRYDMPNWIDPLAKDLLTRMLLVDVKKRITIPEILSHPWLTTNYTTCDTPDSGVVILAPPLPPSPSELAQPVTSPEDIDQDLLASLRVIWGKHTDTRGDNIIRDLCSPPGYGTHAKAFYFLLNRYREETMRKRLIDGPTDYQDMTRSSPEGQRIFKFYRPRAQTSPIHQRPHPALLTMSQPSPGTIASKEITSNVGQPLPSPVGQPLPSPVGQPLPSPVGPRPPPVQSSRAQAEAWRNQFQQDFSPNTAHTPTSPQSRPSSALGVGRGGPRPHPTRRGTGNSDMPSFGFAQNLQTLQDKSLHRSRSQSKAATQVPLLTAPKMADPVLQHTMDKITECVNDYVVHQVSSTSSPHHNRGSFSPVKPHQPPSQAPGRETRRDRVSTRNKAHRSVDKENQSASDEGWSYIGSDPDQNSFGLGVDVRDIGKDVGNLPRNVISPSRGRKEKEKKNRPPPLDLGQRNSSLNVLGSPINLSSPAQSTPVSGGSGRLITSPVVGEFKGWFTNLFNWKSSGQGMFYTVHGIPRTRMDIGRILESFGINVDGTGPTVADIEQSDMLRCRLDLVTTDSLTGTTWKPTRFRVEFSAGQLYSPLSPKENVFPNNSVSATPATAPRARVTSFMGKATISSTPLPSPGPLASVHLPPGYTCAVIMVYEKGSMTTFKAVWRRLKELFGDSPTAQSCFSPAMPTTPFADNHQRLALN
ncbi:Pkinase-domain-containing protein [Macrolepiota fuliginosa MF-IS2]|uniref:non-specific serine/threonine protein kinase n=1 Tax=Macrolepiota fuliginosa MF-IS2 TaxID=1400762 RepID=A0A9P5XAZ7_9AGAR|nr:Pkinase-domain-containing protein [Macrolepiota fuliginosa MF-IS2]